MRCLTLSLLLAVAACAHDDGAWPTLARRPIEGPPLATAAPRRCAVASGPASCLPPPAPATSASTVATPTVAAATPATTTTVSPAAAVAIDDATAKLAVIDRDLSDAATRFAAQRSVATTAAAAARGGPPQGEAWARAQIELTALDRIGNQIGDLRARLDQVAGTLAAASSGGTDVAAPLAETGRLIARATALGADYDAAAASLR